MTPRGWCLGCDTHDAELAKAATVGAGICWRCLDLIEKEQRAQIEGRQSDRERDGLVSR